MIVATKEQLKIIDRAKKGTKFKISAFAGAAKTSTLVMVADELMHDSLYLAYNKRMATEASEKFPGWVEVRTTHSLAYGVTGKTIAHKLIRPQGAYKNVAGTASEIGKYFKLAPIEMDEKHKISQVALGKIVRDTVNKFEYSADKRLTADHVVFGSSIPWIKKRKITATAIVDRVLKAAQQLWKLRSDAKSNVMATHETYLKMFQLSNPDLSKYGTIYLDEAQDSNECILDIVSKQKAQVILVGDNYQSIYQWRGSMNALDKVKADSLGLSSSFRFGQAVADVANTILNASEKVNIVGWDKLNSSVTDRESDVCFPYTKIYRTNAALVEEAVNLINKGVKLHVEIDFRDLIKTINSAVALRDGLKKEVKHDMFISCETWDDALNEAEYNHEMDRIVKMVNSGAYVDILVALENYKPSVHPDVTLITAHKSKGLEWDRVIIGDDFPPVYNAEGKYVWDEQERNLAYVAHTRAKVQLCVGNCVKQIVEHSSYGTDRDVTQLRFVP